MPSFDALDSEDYLKQASVFGDNLAAAAQEQAGGPVTPQQAMELVAPYVTPSGEVPHDEIIDNRDFQDIRTVAVANVINGSDRITDTRLLVNLMGSEEENVAGDDKIIGEYHGAGRMYREIVATEDELPFSRRSVLAGLLRATNMDELQQELLTVRRHALTEVAAVREESRLRQMLARSIIPEAVEYGDMHPGDWQAVDETDGAVTEAEADAGLSPDATPKPAAA